MSRNSKMTLWAESSALLRGARRGAEKKRTDCLPKITKKCQSKRSALGGESPRPPAGFHFSLRIERLN